MKIGTVKWYDSSKGFGVISTPEDKEYFLHFTNIIKNNINIQPGSILVFKPENSKNKDIATKVREFNTNDDLDWIMSMKLLGLINSVTIQQNTNASKGQITNSIKSHIVTRNLLQMCTNLYISNKTEQEILKSFKYYFDTHLDKNLYEEFCHLIENTQISNPKTLDNTEGINTLYVYFNNKIDNTIIFTLWKTNKLKFLGLKNTDNQEIPLEVLRENLKDLGIKEYLRILNFSNGNHICYQLILQKISQEDLPDFDYTLLQIYHIIEKLNEFDKEYLTNNLDEKIHKSLIKKLNHTINSVKTIKSNNDLIQFESIKKLIPNKMSNKYQEQLNNLIDKSITSNCDENYKINLLIKKYNIIVSTEQMCEKFLQIDTSFNERSIIMNASTTAQLSLIMTSYTNQYGIEPCHQLIINYIRSKSNNHIEDILMETPLNSKKSSDSTSTKLIDIYNSLIETKTTSLEKLQLFITGKMFNIPKEAILENLNSCSVDDLTYILNDSRCDKDFALQISAKATEIIEETNLVFLLPLINKKLTLENYIIIDSIVIKRVSEDLYFELWKTKLTISLPINKIKETLADKKNSYTNLINWINNQLISKNESVGILIDKIKEIKLITDQIQFYTVFYCTRTAIEIAPDCSAELEEINNPVVKITLWLIGKLNNVSFDELKSKFIYFKPEHQPTVLKKIFYFINIGILNLPATEVIKLITIDKDIYETNEKLETGVDLDISSNLIIHAIESYMTNGKFLVQSELLSFVLNLVKDKPTKKIKIDSYFEKCPGRMEANYNWRTNGEIEKIRRPDSTIVYAVKFEYNKDMINEIKKIPGRTWNGATESWEIPIEREKSILEFANTYKLFLNFSKNHYADNTHLVNLKRGNVPRGIKFCEGRIAEKNHIHLNIPFWWCSGSTCFENCESEFQHKHWTNYSLLDFVKILGLNLDEHKVGHTIPNGHYYQFVGAINRFNQLLEKMYCNTCNHILYPLETSHYAAHTVVKFYCNNTDCASHKSIVYLNHCLNSKCNSIIDSRVSKKCPNGLHICENCGTCCSHNMLQRRLNNLELTGGFIHNSLNYQVEHKLGHFERALYYCYKCGTQTQESKNEVFHCSTCNITYDLAKDKFKRPHKSLKVPPDYP